MREVEVLVELFTEIKIARQKLSSLEFKGTKKTLDIYYYDPLRKNLQLNAAKKLMECCRLRTKNNHHYFAYKIDIYNGEIWNYSDEFETEIADFEAMQNILRNIGLKELVIIDNIKHVYTNEKFEIIIEEVNNLGNFLEVEYLHDDEKRPVDHIKDDIYEFISTLNLQIGPELNSGKPELLLLKNEVK